MLVSPTGVSGTLDLVSQYTGTFPQAQAPIPLGRKGSVRQALLPYPLLGKASPYTGIDDLVDYHSGSTPKSGISPSHRLLMI